MKRLISLLIITMMLLGTIHAYAGETDNATQVHTNPFDFETKTVTLNDGNEMPIIGIGTFTLSDEQAEESVYWSLYYGGRLIDTAAA